MEHSKFLTAQIIIGLLCVMLGIYTVSNSVFIGLFIVACGAVLSIGTIVLILKVK